MLRQGGRQIAVGLGVGLLLALGITTAGADGIGNMLFGVSARDPLACAAAFALVALASLVAVVVPDQLLRQPSCGLREREDGNSLQCPRPPRAHQLVASPGLVEHELGDSQLERRASPPLITGQRLPCGRDDTNGRAPWRHISIRVTNDKKPDRFVQSDADPSLLVFPVLVVKFRQ